MGEGIEAGLVKTNVRGWWSGVVVSTLALINEVNLRRAQLVLKWVTVSGSIPGAGHLFQYETNQPPKANSAFHPSGVGK